jgi:hypothetical protein
MAITISRAKRFIRWKSHDGALPPWSGRCAIPVLIGYFESENYEKCLEHALINGWIILACTDKFVYSILSVALHY